MPSSSKQTKTTNMGPWQPMQGTILDQAPAALKQGYDAAVNNPLIGQASGYLSDVIGGKYSDIANNQQLQDVMALAGKRAMGQYESMAAGHGRNLTGPDLMRAAMEGVGTSQINPALQMYQFERGNQQTAAGMAPAINTALYAPGLAYSSGLAELGRLGQSGTETTETTQRNPMGMAMTAAGLLAAPFTGGASLGLLGAGGAGMAGAFSPGGAFSSQYGPPSPTSPMSPMSQWKLPWT